MSSSKIPTALQLCRHCGAENRADATKCWLCGQVDWLPSLGPSEPAERRDPSSPASAVQPGSTLKDVFGPPTVLLPRQRSRSIGAIMIAIAAIAILLGSWRAAPGLVVFAIVIGLPIAGLLWYVAARSQHRRLSDVEIVLLAIALLFFGPILLLAAVVIALFIVCSLTLR